MAFRDPEDLKILGIHGKLIIRINDADRESDKAKVWPRQALQKQHRLRRRTLDQKKELLPFKGR